MMAGETCVRINVVKSYHDGGYYAEVWVASSGEELHTTGVYQTHAVALTNARKWAEKSGYKVFT